jgi:uncharacterized repeat protein (TIGR03803 family)
MKRSRRSSTPAALALAAITLCLAVRAQAQTESTLFSFPGGSAGSLPYTGLVRDASGNLYGVTEEGGQTGGECFSYGCGVVFELSPDGSGGWTQTVLHTFTGGTDGHFPASTLLIDDAGNLYGTTVEGGDVNDCSPYGCGVVFELSPSSSGWTETVLYTFHGNDGSGPSALIRDASGNLYGVTGVGGSANKGTVYKLTAGSTGWTKSLIHTFTGGADGYIPNGLVLDATGHLYGTTGFGGNLADCQSQGCGVVFKMTSGVGGWHESVIYTFTGTTDGINPNGVILDAAGNLYGTTYSGGNTTCNSEGCGLVFRLTSGASGWHETVIHTFGGPNGQNPAANLVEDASGNLYGTTFYGGNKSTQCGTNYGCGVVFKLSPGSTGGWTPSLLHIFKKTDGANSQAALTMDDSGNLYGTTLDGGAGNSGVVFEIQP